MFMLLMGRHPFVRSDGRKRPNFAEMYVIMDRTRLVNDMRISDKGMFIPDLKKT